MIKLGKYCNSKPSHSYEYALNFSTYGNVLRINNYRPIKIQKYSNMSIYIPILLYIVNTNKLIIVADVTYFNIVL